MNNIELQKEVARKLKNAVVCRTNLILGHAVEVFKQIYKGEIITLTNAQEVKDFIEEYNYPLEKPVVFEDLSNMNEFVQSYLLKFIEEPLFPIIALSSNDNITDVLQSRFVNIVKVKSPNIVNSTLTVRDFVLSRHKDALNEDKDLNYDSIFYSEEELQKMDLSIMRICPEYLYLKQKYNPKVSLKADSFDKYLILVDFLD